MINSQVKVYHFMWFRYHNEQIPSWWNNFLFYLLPTFWYCHLLNVKLDSEYSVSMILNNRWQVHFLDFLAIHLPLDSSVDTTSIRFQVSWNFCSVYDMNRWILQKKCSLLSKCHLQKTSIYQLWKAWFSVCKSGLLNIWNQGKLCRHLTWEER